MFAPPVFSGPVGVFTDANSAALASDFTASIDWGDGTPPTTGTIVKLLGGTSLEVTGSHTYAASGVNGGTGHYPIQVFVQDAGGSTLTITNVANVADIPIALTGILNPASDSGVSNSDHITNVTQPDFFGSSQPVLERPSVCNGHRGWNPRCPSARSRPAVTDRGTSRRP